jgi:tRNA (cytidine32/uridine32-2'-O)-methyltransferase
MVVRADGRTGGRADGGSDHRSMGRGEDSSRDPEPSPSKESSARPPVRPSAPVLVLVNPQDLVNIASAVRIARNFGIERMRLVNPEAFDPWRIEGIAHNSAEFVARIEILDSLESAVSDCVHVAVLTARGRTAKRRTLRPREAAAELLERSDSGPVAMVVGREDRGLTNAELDVGHVLVTIPTDSRSPSLNLAQAVAIMAYESWLARGGEGLPLKPPRKGTPPATSAQLEELFGDWRRALWAVDFFKTRRSESVMRSFREVVHRAALDGREASLVRAMGIEVVRYLERAGLPVGEPPLAGPS